MRSRAPGTAIAVALVLAGCGGSSSSSSSSSTAVSQTTSATASPPVSATPTTSSTATAKAHTSASSSSTSVATAPPPTPPSTPTAPDGLRQTVGFSSYELCSLKPCTGAVPSSLRAKIHIPKLPAGTPCIAEVATGPVKPNVTGTLRVTQFIGSKWSGGRVTWTAPQNFTGPILIRGRAIGGAHAVGFGEGHIPYDELQLKAVAGQLHEWPSFTRVRGPGCYAYQVDTAAFSAVISFKVTR